MEDLALLEYDDGMVIVWEMETGKPLKSLFSHTSSVNYLLVTEDGKTLYSAAIPMEQSKSGLCLN
jgi:WD40 repeat protein